MSELGAMTRQGVTAMRTNYLLAVPHGRYYSWTHGLGRHPEVTVKYRHGDSFKDAEVVGLAANVFEFRAIAERHYTRHPVGKDVIHNNDDIPETLDDCDLGDEPSVSSSGCTELWLCLLGIPRAEARKLRKAHRDPFEFQERAEEAILAHLSNQGSTVPDAPRVKPPAPDAPLQEIDWDVVVRHSIPRTEAEDLQAAPLKHGHKTYRVRCELPGKAFNIARCLARADGLADLVTISATPRNGYVYEGGEDD